ncbi:Poly(R)-hydroxyalkanoic acid synthase subunit [compost metagenome]
MQREYQGRADVYVETIRNVLDDAFRRFEAKLAEHEVPGSQLTSARAMFDLWIDAAEEAYAKVAMSEDFQRIYADLANAQMRLRAASQQELERACETMGMPTRSEMDAAHRRITELERQIRHLIAATSAPAARQAADRAAPASGKRAAAAAKPKTESKAKPSAKPKAKAKPATKATAKPVAKAKPKKATTKSTRSKTTSGRGKA